MFYPLSTVTQFSVYKFAIKDLLYFLFLFSVDYHWRRGSDPLA